MQLRIEPRIRPGERGNRRQIHREIKRVVGAALTALLVASGLTVLATAPASADTTNPRTWIASDNTFFAWTDAGETLDVNFSPFNIKTVDTNFEGGNQQARNEVRPGINVTVTDPAGVVSTCTLPTGTKVADVNAFNGDATNLPATHGVNVCDWQNLNSTASGVWQIDFVRGPDEAFETAVKWNITAKDGGTAVPGRVWTDRFAGTSYGRGGVDGQGWSAGMFDLSLWYVGENGYIYRGDYKDFNGYGYSIQTDSFGVTTGIDTCESAYKSAPIYNAENPNAVDGYPVGSADWAKLQGINGGPRGLSNGRCGPAYHIFFDTPAPDLPASAQLAGGSTVIVKPDIQTPQITSVTYAPTAEGSLAGTFSGTALNFTGNVDLLVDVDNNGTYDLTVPGSVDASGVLTATWDGKDQNGDPVPVTNTVKVSAQVSKLGEIHFVRDDVEYSGGIEVTRLNGLNNNGPEAVELYWDDTDLAGGLSGTEDGAQRICSTDPQVSTGTTGNVHIWKNGCASPTPPTANANNGTNGSWGDARWIDDWTYETYQMDPYVIQLGPLPTVKVIKDVESRVTGSEDEFTVGVRTADDTELASATTEDGADSAETGAQGVLPDRTYTIFDTTTSGSNPITGYDSSVACEDGDSNSVATTAGNAAGTWTITTPQSEVYVVEGSNATPIAPYDVTCTITNVAKDAPTAGPDTVTVDQGETATLNPEVTPGDGDIVSATFDNGETTKVVDGEGTWSISVDDDGNVTATFTPEDGFTGPVTQQTYTVIDENGLTASSTLDVIIRPKAGDDSATINPGQTATLNPEVTPGSSKVITKAEFDNGETTKTVPGEGTWEISVDDEGNVTATFTPEDGYDGPVTPQEYTVTDENDLTATGNLSVEINQGPEAEDDEVTVNPGQTATLNPEATPGNSPIVSVAFDNGETTKMVPGEGTWTIELVDGQPVATFTPEDGFEGPVTPQEYTVTDENGLTATAELKVNINEPPQAGDDSAIIKPGETATLNPEVTPGTGAIETATFDNGETTKVVDGEGTWTIELVDGQPVVTFTPEDGYDGPVTPQEYTVTDENGLTATGNLEVTIVHTALLLEKGYTIVDDANDNGINDPGDIVKWTFTVTNTGNVPLNDIVVNDPKLDELGIAVTCDPTSLEAKGVAECESGEYTITEADAEAGSIKNIATATGTVPPDTPGDPENPTSPPDEVEIPTDPTPAPALELDKDYTVVSDTNKNGINDPGDIVKWTFTVTNTGNVPLNDITVNDPKLDELGIAVTCDTAPLLPGLSTECESGEYTITDADAEAGSIKNVATATGTVPPGTPGDPENPTSPPDEVEIPTDPTPAPSLDLTKTAFLNDKNGNKKADAGETIDYSFVVTNTGNTQLTGVGVNDPMLEKLGIDVTCTPTTLTPGAKATCTADKAYTVTEQDVKNGKVHNVATAHGTPPEGIDPPKEPKAEVNVPTGPVPDKPGLPVTGGQVMWPLAGAGVLALLAGGVLLMVRKRNREEQTL